MMSTRSLSHINFLGEHYYWKGSSSHSDLQITSSIAVNVTDIKHKIIGLEKQLNEVSKQCRDFTSLDETVRKGSQRQSLARKLRDETSLEKTSSGTQLERLETELLYKQAKDNNYVSKSDYQTVKLESIDKMSDFYDEKIPKLMKTNNSNDSNVTHNYRKHKTKSVHENFVAAYSTSSFHSLNQYKETFHSNLSCSDDDNEKRNRAKIINDPYKDKMYREHIKTANHERYKHHHRHEEGGEQCSKNLKPKRISNQLDQDFITDIIRRQYKPVQLIGTRESDLSQFSTPVCRDLQFYHTGSNLVQEDPQQRGCCCGGPHYTRYAHHSDHSDMRSVRNARLYSLKRNTHKHRKKYVEAYNDSEIYDLVPVKEKSSPKSRRKFYEDNIRPSGVYREVPPSPRSHRPRLNLKAQNYAGTDNNMDSVRNPRKIISPKRAMRPQETDEHEENYHPSEMQKMEKYKHLQNSINCHDPVEKHRKMEGMSILQCPELDIEEHTATVENPLNKTQETVSADKTDKALCEIKDILQSFLKEIKKETTLHSGKSDVSSKINENCNIPSNEVNETHSNGQTFHSKPVQFPVSPTPHMTPFGNNTCCYPMMPVCPMNYMPNSYPVPSMSFTCNTCVSPKSKEIYHNENVTKNDAENETLNYETDELIKEIYKFVSTSPKFSRKKNDSKEDNNRRTDYTIDTKKLTSRSAGSTRVCSRDIKIGTPKINGVSKSCEAIRSKTSSDISSSDTSTGYSGSVLDKLSLEATHSASATKLFELDKVKRSKLAKVLKSLGLRKKKKRDAIEEISESESTIEVEVKKKNPPFRQNLINYSMYGQEYQRPPPVTPHYQEYYGSPYNPDDSYDNFNSHRMKQSINESRAPKPQHHPGQCPTAPPYPHSYEGFNPVHPQLPLCLKEIEVKSIGCQSERKMSFFRKMTQKAQQEAMRREIPKNCSTQTAQNKAKLLSWKNAEMKLLDREADPYGYSFKTQKKLAEGDVKLRNAMLKKLFHKRNPFSPGNLILRTLLGRDKSSFGNPPAMYKPRMFL